MRSIKFLRICISQKSCPIDEPANEKVTKNKDLLDWARKFAPFILKLKKIDRAAVFGRKNDFEAVGGQKISEHPKLFSGFWIISKPLLQDDTYQRYLCEQRLLIFCTSSQWKWIHFCTIYSHRLNHCWWSWI